MNYIDEVWKAIPGYEGQYEASNKGRIRSIKRAAPHILKPVEGRDGYLLVNLSIGGKAKSHAIHRLVALAFIANPHNKPTVDHIDRCKTNNVPSNLRWASWEEQINNVTERSANNPDTKFNVQCVETNEIFKNCSRAAEWVIDQGYSKGIKRSVSEKIRKVCRHEKSYITAYGYHWEFYRGGDNND